MTFGDVARNSERWPIYVINSVDVPTQLTWSAMIRSLSFDRQSAERLKTESPIFCLAQLDIGTPHETRFSSNLFKLLNACSKPYFFLARIS